MRFELPENVSYAVGLKSRTLNKTQNLSTLRLWILESCQILWLFLFKFSGSFCEFAYCSNPQPRPQCGHHTKVNSCEYPTGFWPAPAMGTAWKSGTPAAWMRSRMQKTKMKPPGSRRHRLVVLHLRAFRADKPGNDLQCSSSLCTSVLRYTMLFLGGMT